MPYFDENATRFPINTPADASSTEGVESNLAMKDIAFRIALGDRPFYKGVRKIGETPARKGTSEFQLGSDTALNQAYKAQDDAIATNVFCTWLATRTPAELNKLTSENILQGLTTNTGARRFEDDLISNIQKGFMAGRKVIDTLAKIGKFAALPDANVLTEPAQLTAALKTLETAKKLSVKVDEALKTLSTHGCPNTDARCSKLQVWKDAYLALENTVKEAKNAITAKEEADRKAKEEADRKAKEEAERTAKEEADRKAQAEADKKAKEEADAKAKEEADVKAKEEADRKAQEEADRKEKAEEQKRTEQEQETARGKLNTNESAAWLMLTLTAAVERAQSLPLETLQQVLEAEKKLKKAGSELENVTALIDQADQAAQEAQQTDIFKEQLTALHVAHTAKKEGIETLTTTIRATKEKLVNELKTQITTAIKVGAPTLLGNETFSQLTEFDGPLEEARAFLNAANAALVEVPDQERVTLDLQCTNVMGIINGQLTSAEESITKAKAKIIDQTEVEANDVIQVVNAIGTLLSEPAKQTPQALSDAATKLAEAQIFAQEFFAKLNSDVELKKTIFDSAIDQDRELLTEIENVKINELADTVEKTKKNLTDQLAAAETAVQAVEHLVQSLAVDADLDVLTTALSNLENVTDLINTANDKIVNIPTDSERAKFLARLIDVQKNISAKKNAIEEGIKTKVNHIVNELNTKINAVDAAVNTTILSELTEFDNQLKETRKSFNAAAVALKDVPDAKREELGLQREDKMVDIRKQLTNAEDSITKAKAAIIDLAKNEVNTILRVVMAIGELLLNPETLTLSELTDAAKKLTEAQTLAQKFFEKLNPDAELKTTISLYLENEKGKKLADIEGKIDGLVVDLESKKTELTKNLESAAAAVQAVGNLVKSPADGATLVVLTAALDELKNVKKLIDAANDKIANIPADENSLALSKRLEEARQKIPTAITTITGRMEIAVLLAEKEQRAEQEREQQNAVADLKTNESAERIMLMLNAEVPMAAIAVQHLLHSSRPKTLPQVLKAEKELNDASVELKNVTERIAQVNEAPLTGILKRQFRELASLNAATTENIETVKTKIRSAQSAKAKLVGELKTQVNAAIDAVEASTHSYSNETSGTFKTFSQLTEFDNQLKKAKTLFDAANIELAVVPDEERVELGLQREDKMVDIRKQLTNAEKSISDAKAAIISPLKVDADNVIQAVRDIDIKALLSNPETTLLGLIDAEKKLTEAKTFFESLELNAELKATISLYLEKEKGETLVNIKNEINDLVADVESKKTAKAREEADAKAKEEAKRKAKEEADRKAQEEADKKAKEEAERKAKEEAERKAKEEADRKAQEEADKKAKEEAERKAKEEATKTSTIKDLLDKVNVLVPSNFNATAKGAGDATFNAKKLIDKAKEVFKTIPEAHQDKILNSQITEAEEKVTNASLKVTEALAAQVEIVKELRDIGYYSAARDLSFHDAEKVLAQHAGTPDQHGSTYIGAFCLQTKNQTGTLVGGDIKKFKNMLSAYVTKAEFTTPATLLFLMHKPSGGTGHDTVLEIQIDKDKKITINNVNSSLEKGAQEKWDNLDASAVVKAVKEVLPTTADYKYESEAQHVPSPLGKQEDLECIYYSVANIAGGYDGAPDSVLGKCVSNSKIENKPAMKLAVVKMMVDVAAAKGQEKIESACLVIANKDHVEKYKDVVAPNTFNVGDIIYPPTLDKLRVAKPTKPDAKSVESSASITESFDPFAGLTPEQKKAAMNDALDAIEKINWPLTAPGSSVIKVECAKLSGTPREVNVDDGRTFLTATVSKPVAPGAPSETQTIDIVLKRSSETRTLSDGKTEGGVQRYCEIRDSHGMNKDELWKMQCELMAAQSFAERQAAVRVSGGRLRTEIMVSIEDASPTVTMTIENRSYANYFTAKEAVLIQAYLAAGYTKVHMPGNRVVCKEGTVSEFPISTIFEPRDQNLRKDSQESAHKKVEPIPPGGGSGG